METKAEAGMATLLLYAGMVIAGAAIYGVLRVCRVPRPLSFLIPGVFLPPCAILAINNWEGHPFSGWTILAMAITTVLCSSGALVPLMTEVGIELYQSYRKGQRPR